MLSKFKAWVHAVTAPEHVPSYSTHDKAEPFSFKLEFVGVPRYPIKPEEVSDALFKEALDNIRDIGFFSSQPRFIIVKYYPRQKEMVIEYPLDELHSFL